MENTINMNRDQILSKAKKHLASNPKESIDLLLQQLRNDPMDLECYEMIIPAFEKAGYIERAKQLQEAAIAQFPEHTAFKNLELCNQISSSKAQIKFEPLPLENRFSLYSLYKLPKLYKESIPKEFLPQWLYFQQEIKEGHLAYAFYINIANSLFSYSGENPQLKEIGIFCLVKVLETNPLELRIWNLLLKLFPKNEMIHSKVDFLNTQTDLSSQIETLITQWNLNQKDEAFQSLYNLYEQYPNNIYLDWVFLEWSAEMNQDLFLKNQNLIADKWQASPFQTNIQAQIGTQYFSLKNFPKAIDHLQKAVQEEENCFWYNLLGESHFELKNKKMVGQYWSHSLILDSEQSHLYFKLNQLEDHIFHIPATEVKDQKICILLYSWNKADLIDETLLSLSKSNIGKAKIIILDNNSTDHMQSVLTKAKAYFPNNFYRTITLPTNIGAPAARNWLMAQPEAKESDYICYLDDDVLLPKNWLEILLHDVNSRPKIGVAGFKICNPDSVNTLQYWGQNIALITDEKVSLTRKHAGVRDYNQLNYKRPCINVMGCCHIFKKEALYQSGEFDVRFSPSQVDDIEHDVRIALAGFETHYNGYVKIIHKQMSGKIVQSQKPSEGNVKGNLIKFRYKYQYEELIQLKEKTDQLYYEALKNSILSLRTINPKIPQSQLLF